MEKNYSINMKIPGAHFQMKHAWTKSCPQTDRLTDRQAKTNIPPNFVCWGYNNALTMAQWYCESGSINFLSVMTMFDCMLEQYDVTEVIARPWCNNID